MEKGDLNSRGFTIIEVALVLAIAGLIFLMVFIALPGLRASQRDTDRRTHMISFLDSVKKYQTATRGALPGGSDGADVVDVVWDGTGGIATSWKGFYKDYLGGNFMDPSGENYKLKILKCGAQTEQSCETNSSNSALSQIYDSSFPNNYMIIVVKQATCNGNHAVGSSNPRKLAVLYRLERADVYCNNT